MSDFINGADVLRRFTRDYEALQGLAKSLDEIGSYDQALAERKALLAAEDAKLAEAKMTRELVDREIFVARETAEGLIDGAKKDAAALREGAATEVAGALAEAQRKAEQIVAEAKAAADAVAKGAADAAEKAHAEVSEAAKQRDDALEEARVAGVELAEIEKKLAAAREAARQLLGGAA